MDPIKIATEQLISDCGGKIIELYPKRKHLTLVRKVNGEEYLDYNPAFYIAAKPLLIPIYQFKAELMVYVSAIGPKVLIQTSWQNVQPAFIGRNFEDKLPCFSGIMRICSRNLFANGFLMEVETAISSRGVFYWA